MPEGAEEAFVDALKASRLGLIEEATATRPKRVSVLAKRERIMELAEALRDDFGFTHPISAGAVDWPGEERMHVIYYLMNPSSRFMLMLRVDLPRDDPRLPALTQVWEGMSFHERETREMFGVEFEGHPNPSRLLLPPDWRGGYPLRKDFKAEGARG